MLAKVIAVQGDSGAMSLLVPATPNRGGKEPANLLSLPSVLPWQAEIANSKGHEHLRNDDRVSGVFGYAAVPNFSVLEPFVLFSLAQRGRGFHFYCGQKGPFGGR